ncbi:MAG TPA: hypothetical protein VL049_07535 [Candidatus Dormibacteraeota bacterium]|nr:hypothetical protein [Candidatus Dormibacteraeota bacterium]
MAYGRAARSCLGWVAVATAVACAGCGNDANLGISNTQQCGGGSGTLIRGVVRMPNGRLAARDGGFASRLAALAVAPVEALTGHVSPVGKGVSVELVQLRPEDLASGSEPGAVAYATTNDKGEFCVPLARDTTVDVCRYMLRVGSIDDGTRTRAFVYSSDEATDIDFTSEATVQAILDDVPPASLCDFSTDEIAGIHEAVRALPGNVSGGSVAEVNALATTVAVGDANVRALVAEAGNLPPPTATNVPGAPTATAPPPPTATAVVPTVTHTHSGPTSTPTLRPTRTPNGPTVTSTPSRTPVPSRTNTPGAATATATAPAATATATRPAVTATATATRPAVTATATRPAVTPTVGPPTPTFTATPMPADLGERVFTIREDSKFGDANSRVGFFTTGLSGLSVSQNFSPGPLVLEAGALDGNGIATLSLKEDAYFKVNIPAGATVLCIRMLASGSSGRIDCNGGTPFNISLTAAAGPDAPVPTPITGQGTDSGPGSAELRVGQSIAELTAFTDTCDASVTFPAATQTIYTTATFTATKGTKVLAKTGEPFDCAHWTMTDGPGMLVTGVVATDSRAGGDAANITRLADK